MVVSELEDYLDFLVSQISVSYDQMGILSSNVVDAWVDKRFDERIVFVHLEEYYDCRTIAEACIKEALNDPNAPSFLAIGARKLDVVHQNYSIFFPVDNNSMYDLAHFMFTTFVHLNQDNPWNLDGGKLRHLNAHVDRYGAFKVDATCWYKNHNVNHPIDGLIPKVLSSNHPHAYNHGIDLFNTGLNKPKPLVVPLIEPILSYTREIQDNDYSAYLKVRVYPRSIDTNTFFYVNGQELCNFHYAVRCNGPNSNSVLNQGKAYFEVQEDFENIILPDYESKLFDFIDTVQHNIC